VNDLSGVNKRHLHPGNLTTLIGYGPSLFLMDNVKRKKPFELNEVFFKLPNLDGGGSIVEDSAIAYSKDVVTNDTQSQHIIIQFIGDDEFITGRASFETWKLLSRLKNSKGNDSLYIKSVFTGFQRDDGRNWFGFHDGVSNLPSKDRLQVMSIAKKDVTQEDMWTINGTYMAFLRIEFDINEWIKLKETEQSIIIGRDKITGCPLIGVDKNKQPIKDNRCPIRGTFEVIEKGNEIFREHAPFGKQMYLPREFSDNLLQKSHIGTVNPTDEQSNRANAYRIYRQGFEFLEPTGSYPGLRVGLNFISFQRSPKRLSNMLKHRSTPNTQTERSGVPSFDTFFSVRNAGIFLIPPLVMSEPFPGASIFLDEISIAKINKSGLNYTSKMGRQY
jgi:deferrochelatase/peroxidase EfeB